MAAYDIRLSGCDDSTRVTFDLTPDQHELVQSIAAATVAASQFGCMPTMTVTEHTEETDE
jgi:hypothetical protein